MTMSATPSLDVLHPPLIPRYAKQGYDPESVKWRREWAERTTRSNLDRIGKFSISSSQMKGNVENPIGAAQVPLGLAGPLLINGLHAQGVFYIPLATTEGALVRSYERGMAVVTRAGGVNSRVHSDENCIAPTFFFRDLIESYEFASRLQNH